MLRWLGFQLACGRDIGQQRQMDIESLPVVKIDPQLADRFVKCWAFKITDRAADLADHEILVSQVRQHEIFDGIRHMRDHLHGGAKIIAAPFGGNDALINAPAGDIVALPRVDTAKPLVMAKIQVGFRPIVGDEHLAMLRRAHRARVDVQIRVKLAQPHLVTMRLQYDGDTGRSYAFAKRRDNAARNKDKSCQERAPLA